jgi:uncharacterized membrane protein YqjE
MAHPPASAPGGLFASVKGLAAGLVAIAQTRLELLAADVAVARERLIMVLALLQIGLLGLGVGLVLLALLLVLALWDTHRLLALGTVGGSFLLGGVVCAGLALRRLQAAPSVFEASLEELRKDRDQLEGKA